MTASHPDTEGGQDRSSGTEPEEKRPEQAGDSSACPGPAAGGSSSCDAAGRQQEERVVEEIGFFHLTRSPLERALPRLLTQLLERGDRVFLKCADAEMAETLDRFLWTFDPDAFLPHGRVGEGREADQPLLIGWEDDPPANGAEVAVVIAPADLPAGAAARHFRRIAYLFDGDEAAVARARATYRAAAGIARLRKYWRQNPKGGWELAHTDDRTSRPGNPESAAEDGSGKTAPGA